MPIETVQNDPEGVYNRVYDLAISQELEYLNYFLGGAVNNVLTTDTAVHPAMQRAIWNVFANIEVGQNMVFNFIPNTVTGTCFNHHSPVEVDWHDALWGANYDMLVTLKGKYDPTKVFNCWNCIGYEGPENPESDAPYEPVCPEEESHTTSPPTDPPPTVMSLLQLVGQVSVSLLLRFCGVPFSLSHTVVSKLETIYTCC
jgi:hypothetical protein